MKQTVEFLACVLGVPLDCMTTVALPAFTAVTEEAQPCQRGETEGGDSRERSPLLRLRVHEGEPLPADEGQVRGETGTCLGDKHPNHQKLVN